uniref:Ig-like domain-containing protein n=1 Tax=Myripristis murdjan TaxID=586833 RepID=A0A667YYT9_9TELE
MSLVFLLHLAELKLSLSLHQESGFLSANVGDNVTLKCFYEGDVAAKFFWYKQTLGQKPLLMCSFYKFDKNAIFYDEFKNDPHFKLEIETNGTRLKISELQHSDSATYFCVSSYSNNFEFANGVTLSVKGSGLNIQAVVHQSESQTIQPGDSVTLNCTVHTGTCDGEHSVYWFRSSGHSQPRAIYTHGVTDDQCERKPTTHTQTCVYNLPMKSLNLPDAGTYYCAVLSCGEILFGNGTKKDIESDCYSTLTKLNMNTEKKIIASSLAFTITLVVILASSVYKILICCFISSCQGQDADNLHYAALSVNKAHRPRRQRDNTDPNCTSIRLSLSAT